jgi:hypothetical protein
MHAYRCRRRRRAPVPAATESLRVRRVERPPDRASGLARDTPDRGSRARHLRRRDVVDRRQGPVGVRRGRRRFAPDGDQPSSALEDGGPIAHVLQEPVDRALGASALGQRVHREQPRRAAPGRAQRAHGRPHGPRQPALDADHVRARDHTRSNCLEDAVPDDDRRRQLQGLQRSVWTHRRRPRARRRRGSAPRVSEANGSDRAFRRRRVRGSATGPHARAGRACPPQSRSPSASRNTRPTRTRWPSCTAPTPRCTKRKNRAETEWRPAAARERLHDRRAEML